MTQAERAALAQEGAALAASLDVSAPTFYDDLRGLLAVVVSMTAGPEVLTGEHGHEYTLMTEPMVLYRSVSPEEWEQIKRDGEIRGGLNSFNPFDSRREVFFGDSPNGLLLSQGEDVTRRVEYQVQQTPLGEAFKRKAEEVLALQGQLYARTEALGAIPTVLRNKDAEYASLKNQYDKARKELDALKAQAKEQMNSTRATLRQQDAERGYTSVLLTTKPIAGGRVYQGKHSGMGEDKEYGFDSGVVKLSDIASAQLVKDGAIVGDAMAAAPAGGGIAFSLDDKEKSSSSLVGYLQFGISALPAPLAVFEASTVLELATAISAPQVVHAALNFSSSDGMPNPASDQAKLAAYELISARGVDHGISPDVILDKHAAAVQAMNSLSDYSDATAAFRAWNDEQGQLQDRLMSDYRAARDRYAQDSTPESQAAKEAATQALLDFKANYGAEFDRRKAEVDAISKAQGVKRQSLLDEAVREEGEAILAAIAAASPVTHEEAKTWADQQQVDDATLKKLKRLGYDRDAIFQDMADFYRLTGGKCSAIRLSSDGGSRANAVGVGTRLGEKIINVGTRFNRTVLFHELAHHLENDPIARAAANGFLLKRRESEKLYRLKDLTGHKYGKDELAYKDSWLNEYIGKHYDGGITEVFSMGVEFLANPRDAAFFAARDPEMFALISGYLASPLTPAMAAKLNMHGSAMEEKQAQDKATAASVADALETLAKPISISTDNWWQEQIDAQSNVMYSLQQYEFVRGKEPTYIGSHENFRVFQGVFRNAATSRNSKGYLVVELRNREGYTIPSGAAVHDGMVAVRALIALAKRERESGLSTHIDSIKRNHLGGKYGKDEAIKRLVSAAESIKGQAT